MIRHKFHAQPTRVEGEWFASKKEARYWQNLLLARKTGDLLFALRQVRFDLPGGIKYVVDFCEFWKDGDVRFVDVKGYKTTVYLHKKKQVEELYPIHILEA